MKTSFRDISLSKLNHYELEDLRLLRNKYSHFLVYNQKITKESQISWFNNINSQEIYCSVYKGSDLAGFVFAKGLDKINKSFETGILFHEKYQNTSLPPISCIMLSNIMFNVLQYSLAIAIVHKNNIEAINFNLKFGFEVVSNNKDFVFLNIKKNDFSSTKNKFILPILNTQIVNLDNDFIEKYTINQCE
jgi:RimJ/RimL family protein N-acetyltransferase